MHNRNKRNHRQTSFNEIQLKESKERRCIMTKEKWLEIIKLIASFAVGAATIVLNYRDWETKTVREQQLTASNPRMMRLI